MRKLIYVTLTIATALLVGCASGSSSSYTPSSSSSSQVMSQSDVDFTVDHMASQGADRAEAQAFVDTLNDAQREW